MALLRLGVLDQSPIASGCSGAQALRNTLDLAQRVDELGFHRYWVAEHHGGPTLAGTSPEALIGPIAATTSNLRVGSGGVMLPHYSPLKVAETFSVLSGLFAGRIDLGLGRTDGTDDPVTVFGLQRNREHPNPDDFGAQLVELLGVLDDRLAPDHLFAGVPANLPGRPEGPQPWLLGSSAQSAIWAGELGLPYAFADFINPGAGIAITDLYRERFMASPRLAEPQLLVAVWSLCAESDDEAERLASSARMLKLLARRGLFETVPRPEIAMPYLERLDRAIEQPGPGKRMVLGTPIAVADELRELAGEYDTEELLIINLTHDHAARRRSYELLSDAFSLRSQGAGTGGTRRPA